MPNDQSFSIESYRGPYVVRTLPLAHAIPEGLPDSARLLIDEGVRALHPWMSELAATDRTLSVVASESLKTLQGTTQILSWLIESGFDGSEALYVVGGGTVQDVGGFVASIFHRGVPWVFVPTTLLAQGDSCIGSKSSINYGRYKNQLGTFYPPVEVLIDDSFLTTLPPEQVRAGVGEMLHYAALGPESLFRAHEDALTRGWQELKPRDMTGLATKALSVKRNFIEADEFDTGVRKNLNYGHTFAHALEFASEGAIPHGIAVAYGVDLANTYAAERGLLAPVVQARVGRLVRSLVDGAELRMVDGDRLLTGMSKDKKSAQGRVELVLLRDLGDPTRVRVPLDAELAGFLNRYLAAW